MGKSSPLAGSSLSNDTIKCPKSRGEGCDMNADSFDQPSSSSLQLRRLPRARRMWSDLVICQPGKCNNLIPTKPRQRWLNKEAKIWQSIAIIILRAKTQVFVPPSAWSWRHAKQQSLPCPAGKLSSLRWVWSHWAPWIAKKFLAPRNIWMWIVNQPNTSTRGVPVIRRQNMQQAWAYARLRPTPLSLSLFSVSLSCPISSWKWTRLSYLIWSRPSWPWVQNTNMVCSWTSIFDWMPTRPVVKASDENLWGFLHVLSKLHVKSKLLKVTDPYWSLEMVGFLGCFLGPWYPMVKIGPTIASPSIVAAAPQPSAMQRWYRRRWWRSWNWWDPLGASKHRGPATWDGNGWDDYWDIYICILYGILIMIYNYIIYDHI